MMPVRQGFDIGQSDGQDPMVTEIMCPIDGCHKGGWAFQLSSEIENDLDARKKLKSGVDRLAKAVIITLGPRGRNVVFDDPYILIHDKKISGMKEMVPLLDKISQTNEPLARICYDRWV